ncbi:uncharacterized protein [Triticum aestivum]|uniref:uncharacterized protein isoform X2 n=1 Tax=Triticum aestivum TaxID=4565 RepID=UPI001D02DD26|nr:uncharacterized protein LOC123087376 isoform X2 [Triticum aestivum]
MEESDLEFVLDLVDRFPLREEFADNLEHPDPVPLRLLPRGRLALLARRIQMVNLVNREAPRWTKRMVWLLDDAYDTQHWAYMMREKGLKLEPLKIWYHGVSGPAMPYDERYTPYIQ